MLLCPTHIAGEEMDLHSLGDRELCLRKTKGPFCTPRSAQDAARPLCHLLTAWRTLGEGLCAAAAPCLCSSSSTQAPALAAPTAEAMQVWDEHSDISVSPSALAGSICVARTHYTIIMLSFLYVHFGKSPVFHLAISKPVVVWNL